MENFGALGGKSFADCDNCETHMNIFNEKGELKASEKWGG
jgi:hypothetical protein